MEEFKEWLRLWSGFPGALVRVWALLVTVVVVLTLLIR
jgi:hypothetical protein